MAKTKIKAGQAYSAYEKCPKVMLKAYLEKQNWFIAALGSFGSGFMEKAEWERRFEDKNAPGTFYGSDPYELEVILKHEDVDIKIRVCMDDVQGFEIRMGPRQEVRRGDGSLIIWYSNNVEGAAERVKRHYEHHGVPYAEREKESVRAKKEENARREKNKEELEGKMGCSFAKERWGRNYVYEQGTFGMSFRYSIVERHAGFHQDFVGQKMIQVSRIAACFTLEEFKEFLEWMGSRPRFVAERLIGKKCGIETERSS